MITINQIFKSRSWRGHNLLCPLISFRERKAELFGGDAAISQIIQKYLASSSTSVEISDWWIHADWIKLYWKEEEPVQKMEPCGTMDANGRESLEEGHRTMSCTSGKVRIQAKKGKMIQWIGRPRWLSVSVEVLVNPDYQRLRRVFSGEN